MAASASGAPAKNWPIAQTEVGGGNGAAGDGGGSGGDDGGGGDNDDDDNDDTLRFDLSATESSPRGTSAHPRL